MNLYLVKFHDNFGDEFDIHGLQVFTAHEYRCLKEAIFSLRYPKNFYFGTNEFVEYKTPDDFLNRLQCIEISEEDFLILKRTVLDSCDSFGWFPEIFDYVEPEYWPENKEDTGVENE